MGRDKTITVLVSEEEKERIEKAAADEDLLVAAYVRQAVDFRMKFPSEFLAAVQETADVLKYDVPTVIIYLLSYYLSQESVLGDFFKTSKTFQRAFRLDPKRGLLPTDEIAEINEREIREEMERIVAKGKQAKRTGKQPDYSLAECAILSKSL